MDYMHCMRINMLNIFIHCSKTLTKSVEVFAQWMLWNFDFLMKKKNRKMELEINRIKSKCLFFIWESSQLKNYLCFSWNFQESFVCRFSFHSSRSRFIQFKLFVNSNGKICWTSNSFRGHRLTTRFLSHIQVKSHRIGSVRARNADKNDNEVEISVINRR